MNGAHVSGRTLPLRVRGLDCAEEVRLLKREVGPVVGGEDNLAFDVLRGKMTVLSMPDGLGPTEVARAVESAGMHAEPWGEEAPPDRWLARHGRALSVWVSGLLAAAGFLAHAFIAGGALAALAGHGAEGAGPVPPVARALYGLAILAGGWLVFPKAWAAARRLRPDMHLLMTLAVLGAIGIGEWLEAATVTFLFALSLVLESWSVGRARRTVEALLDLSPTTARLLPEEGGERTVPASEVRPGDRLLVKPGERIPLDGEVAAGDSEVDQAPITGESVPVAKSPGDEVFAGTINGGGALQIVATRPADDTTVSRILRMVEEARARRSASERWVERFARVYTPAVLGLALLVLLVPPLLAGASWSTWLYRSLVLLVIACPCALVISTPVSVVAAIASAARHGVLVKGGVFVELPARLAAIAFDKTGTLTEGRFQVVDVIPLNGHSEEELLARAAALEARSEHPLAHAVLELAEEEGISVVPADGFRAYPGKGASGVVEGRAYWLGSHRYLEERGQETPAVHDRLEALSAAGRTVVVVGTDDHVCGLLAVADRVRPDARSALADLRGLGIEHLAMLTGDNEATARAVATDLDLDDVRAELLPEEKVTAVEDLVATHGEVAMVGDGINDAPAMVRSRLGIAMGAAGSDAALETADVALMGDDLSRLPWLVGHSRRTLAVIRTNIVFALAVKALVFGLATAGLATLWMAIAADMGASLLVIGNALRLLRDPGGGPR